METGQKIIQTNNNIGKYSNHILSIQASLSGLSFCILNSKTHIIVYHKTIRFDKKLTPLAVLNKLTHCFNTEEPLQQDYRSVTVIHENDLSTLVPKPLFDESNIANYLKFNSKILKTDFITYDIISANDSINVYVPYVNINNYIYDKFGDFEFKHATSILLETILSTEKRATTKNVYINICDNHFEFFALNKGQLIFYNTFSYYTEEDFIYYILFTLEQLELNPEEINVILLGKISEDSELYSLSYHYIRHVSILKPTSNYTVDNNVSNSKAVFQNTTLLNSF